MSNFTSTLLNWYQKHQRNLPWRGSKDPYKIWLSEIILQQTRVNQGLPYYLKFEEKYPSVNDLAKVDMDELLKLWQGLGYYSRAHNLQKCAVEVAQTHGGAFPNTKAGLLKLPGIGDYTASAIASIAYNESVAVLDGNVFRVLSRYFGIDEFIDTPAGRKVFKELAEQCLDNAPPGDYNQALMEFGALQCKPKSPDCSACPLQTSCVAKTNSLISQLPRKRGKTKVKEVFLNYFCFVADGNLAVAKRDNSGIWKGLYEMPNVLSEKRSTEPWVDSRTIDEALALSSSFKQTIEMQHLLSHRKINATFFICELKNQADLSWPSVEWVDKKGLSKRAVPRLIDKFLKTPDGLALQDMLES